MNNTIVIGSAFGDEGKARVVDYLVPDHDIILRYNGGGNAGHTIYHNGQKIVTHLVPSGVCFKNKDLVIGPGVMVDPEALLQEIALLETTVGYPLNIHLSNQAHVVLKVHKEIDGARERQESPFGSTKRGMAPCAEAKYGKRGVRIEDLIEPHSLEKKVRLNHEHAQKLGVIPPDLQETLSQLAFWGQMLKKYIKDIPLWLYQKQSLNKSILFEGAQGANLDIDHGDYPYVSSSSSLIGGALSGSGTGSTIQKIIGVTKPYLTRVGSGPFVAEQSGEVAQIIRDLGNEWGATTGRSRRCGWLEIPLLKRTKIVSSVNQWALTKVDIVAGMETLPVCYAYLNTETKEQQSISSDYNNSNLIPLYKNFAGWPKFDPSKIKKMTDLPYNLRIFLDYIESETQVPVKIVCFGVDREATVMV